MAFDLARRIQSTIASVIHSPASSLVEPPQTYSESTQDSLKKLQLQVMALADAVAEIAKELEKRGLR